VWTDIIATGRTESAISFAGREQAVREIGRPDQVKDALADVEARRVLARIGLETNALAGIAGGQGNS